MEKKIYLVGGAVRDKLLGIASDDKDYVAVGYAPDDFSHLPLVGKDFPVFLLPDGNELALARVERKIGSGYNGFDVSIVNVTLEEDLHRRDLTINSIAYDEQNDTYIDPFSGKQDIENKILRHTSKAFMEDPLRVLRLARFQAKFGDEWQIAQKTKAFVVDMKDELEHLQPQRVYKEIKKLLGYKNWFLFFETLDQLDLLEILFPSIHTLFLKDQKERVKVLSTKSDDTLVKLVLLYFFIDKPIEIDLPKKTISKVLLLKERLKDSSKFDSLDNDSKIKFFVSFKKDNRLFFNYLQLIHLFKIDISKLRFVNIFESINAYSPKVWIDTQQNSPNPQEIQEHIKEKYLSIIESF